MNEAFCTETHMLNPVKKDQAGVTSTTTQKLQFVSDKHADSVAAGGYNGSNYIDFS